MVNSPCTFEILRQQGCEVSSVCFPFWWLAVVCILTCKRSTASGFSITLYYITITPSSLVVFIHEEVYSFIYCGGIEWMIGHSLQRLGVTVLVPGAIDIAVGKVVTTHGISLMTHTGNELTKILLSSCLGPDGAQSGLYDIRPVITNPGKVDDSELAPSHSEPSICVLVSTESAWNLIWSVDKTSEEFSNRNRSCSLVNLDFRDSQEQLSNPPFQILFMKSTGTVVAS